MLKNIIISSFSVKIFFQLRGKARLCANKKEFKTAYNSFFSDSENKDIKQNFLVLKSMRMHRDQRDGLHNKGYMFIEIDVCWFLERGSIS